MAGSVNKVILVGNLGKDPEIRRTQDGRPIANLSIATSETWRDKGTGERKEKTEWHRVVIFNEGLCKVAEQYLKKGAKVYIEGQLQTRKWTDQSGVEKYSTEVVLQGFNSTLTMLEGRSGGGGGSFGSDDAGGDFGSGGSVSSPPRRASDGSPILRPHELWSSPASLQAITAAVMKTRDSRFRALMPFRPKKSAAEKSSIAPVRTRGNNGNRSGSLNDLSEKAVRPSTIAVYKALLPIPTDEMVPMPVMTTRFVNAPPQLFPAWKKQRTICCPQSRMHCSEQYLLSSGWEHSR